MQETYRVSLTDAESVFLTSVPNTHTLQHSCCPNSVRLNTSATRISLSFSTSLREHVVPNLMSLSDRRKFNRTTNRLCSPNVVLNGLRLVWIVTFIWGELGAFFWSLSGCRWPDSKLVSAYCYVHPIRILTRLVQQGSGKAAHVLLLSDPQVQRPTTWRERSWGTSIRQFLYEYNLKKSWHVANRLNPHVTIFLGDMLATGKLAKTEKE